MKNCQRREQLFAKSYNSAFRRRNIIKKGAILAGRRLMRERAEGQIIVAYLNSSPGLERKSEIYLML